MEETEQFAHPASETIRSIALRLPETDEGTSCVNRAFTAGGKNFAFLGEKDDEIRLRLKLDASVDEVADRYEVGSHGWTMIRFDATAAPSDAELERWVTESFRLLAPKKVVAQLGD